MARGGRPPVHADERPSQLHHPLPANCERDEGGITTGGAGSGTFKPSSGQESAPNASRARAASSSRRIVAFCSRPTAATIPSPASRRQRRRAHAAGRQADGESGEGEAAPPNRWPMPRDGHALRVHSFGPDHLRLMSVDEEGKLTPRPERYTVNTDESPIVCPPWPCSRPTRNSSFSAPRSTSCRTANPDGSLILWIREGDGARSRSLRMRRTRRHRRIPVGEDGALGQACVPRRGGASPFIAFLHNRPDTFVIGAKRLQTGSPSADRRRRQSQRRPGRADRHERRRAL